MLFAIIGEIMKFIELTKSLKERVENVYNITGDDYFLIKQAISNIKHYLIKDMEEFDYVKLDAEKLKSTDIDATLSTLPLANEYRLVVLTNPNSELVKFINKYDFSTLPVVLVCVNADKLAIGEKVDCSKLDRADLTKYILNYLAKFNLSIEERALDYLIDASNQNLTKIVNELSKLTAYAMDTDTITIEIATNLISNTSEYAIYMLTNSIDNKDYTSYQKVLNELTKSQTMGEVFSYLGKYFKRMQYICLNKQDTELANILNIKPYAIKMSRQFIAQNGIKFYLDLYQKYVDLDYKIKNGKITATNALYELIF